MTPSAIAEAYGSVVGTGISGSDSHEEIVLMCPGCGKPKLSVNASTGRWTCYYCASNGSLPYRRNMTGLLMLLSGMSLHEAHETLRASTHDAIAAAMSTLRPSAKPWAEEKPESVVIPGQPITPGNRGYDYMRCRAIRPKTFERFGCLFCERDDAWEGRFSQRIILPCLVGGRCVGFQGRAVNGAVPKYITQRIAQSRLLFGVDQAAGAAEVIVVEGAFDVLRLAQLGFDAVATLGKNVNDGHAATLRRAGFERAILMLDPDAIVDAITGSAALESTMNVKVASLVGAKDPGEASRAQIQSALLNARSTFAVASAFLG